MNLFSLFLVFGSVDFKSLHSSAIIILELSKIKRRKIIPELGG